MFSERQPSNFDDLKYHSEVNYFLKALAHSQNICHLIFIGNRGSGRHNRAQAFLKEVYGINNLNCVPSTITVETKTTTVDVPIISSSVHIEINPSQAGVSDILLVQQVILESAKQKNPGKNNRQLKFIFIQEADKLTMIAQQALRRLMEQYSTTCKIIFFVNNPNALIMPIRSRAQQIRVKPFTNQEIKEILNETNKNLIDLVDLQPDQEAIEEICQLSDGNLRLALCMLQAKHLCIKNTIGNENVIPKYIQYLNVLYEKYYASKQQTQQYNQEFNNQILEILKLGVPGSEIIRYLYQKLINDQYVQRSPQALQNITNTCLEYSCRIRNQLIPFPHVMAFCLFTLNVVCSLK